MRVRSCEAHSLHKVLFADHISSSCCLLRKYKSQLGPQDAWLSSNCCTARYECAGKPATRVAAMQLYLTGSSGRDFGLGKAFFGDHVSSSGCLHCHRKSHTCFQVAWCACLSSLRCTTQHKFTSCSTRRAASTQPYLASILDIIHKCENCKCNAGSTCC